MLKKLIGYRAGWFVFLFLLIGVYSASIVQAAEQPNWRISMDVDYLGVGNQNSTLKNEAGNCFAVGGAKNCSISANSAGAEGVRIKLSNEHAGINMGPSVGYLNGGPGVGNQVVRWSNAGNIIAVTTTANTLRFLEEANKILPLTNSFSARLGAGLGVAVESETTTESGSTNGFAENLSLGWLTWEFSPAVVYKSVSLGARYVGFARGGQIPWNTFGAFFGVDF